MKYLYTLSSVTAIPFDNSLIERLMKYILEYVLPVSIYPFIHLISVRIIQRICSKQLFAIFNEHGNFLVIGLIFKWF